MYYGEEVGMENNDPKRKEDVKDPEGRTGWPNEKGRDGERAPMQWSDSANAGFSEHEPWLPVPGSYKTHNVAVESKNPDSVLEFYRKLLALRHQNTVILEGTYKAVNEDDPNLLSYLRSYKGESVLVVLNMSDAPQKANFDSTIQGVKQANFKPLVATSGSESKGSEVALAPFGVFIAQVQGK